MVELRAEDYNVRWTIIKAAKVIHTAVCKHYSFGHCPSSIHMIRDSTSSYTDTSMEYVTT